ncbi:MAG: hypothetical protein U0136_13320 [Bdellovibrionota bacterium]
METTSVRDSRLSSIIAQELELILCSASDDRVAALTVVYVRPASGGHRFEVGLAPYADDVDPNVLENILSRAGTFLRTELISALNLKRAPSFQFVLVPEDVAYED